ncbi:MAG: hypothetical protein AAF587_02215 [Bacteroidota bacterium]
MAQFLTRRGFNQQMMSHILAFSFWETVLLQDMIANPLKPITDRWANQLNEMCSDLRTNTLSPSQWQDQLEELFQQLAFEEVLRMIDFDRLSKGFVYPDLGVNTKVVRFPKLAGLPDRLAFYPKIFGMKKDRAIIPHGHKNMASAHLVIKGEFALKHYDKVREEANHLIIRPSIDKVLTVGEASSISDEKDNIHWFRATSDVAFTFDVIVLDLNDRQYEIDNIDPYAAENLSGGLLRAPKLDVQEALRKYGK